MSFILPRLNPPKFSDNQHEAHKVAMGGPYPSVCEDQIQKVLKPCPGETRRILDLDHHATLLDSIKCLKPGGMIIFIDPLHNMKEDRNALYDPASSTNLGARVIGNDIKGGEMDIAQGFWDLEECDPNTCGAVEMACP
ncbi:14529_t:CDS:2, partial [Acaulospora colombiana]